MNTTKRKIDGASAGQIDSVKTTTTQINYKDVLSFSACPEEYTTLIKNVDLDQMVFWKLQQVLQDSNLQSTGDLLKEAHADMERPLFAIVLKATKGNQSKAADVLGCNRNTLHRKLKEFSIDPKALRNKKRSVSLQPTAAAAR